MKAPLDPSDPLIRSFADEAANLPIQAAREARKMRSLRVKRRRQIAIMMTFVFCGVCVWQFLPQDQVGREPITFQLPQEVPIVVTEPDVHGLQPVPGPSTPVTPQPRDVAMTVRTEEHARNEPLPLPEGLTKEQESVVMAAQGLPLLLVRDGTGKVVRIHVVER